MYTHVCSVVVYLHACLSTFWCVYLSLWTLCACVFSYAIVLFSLNFSPNLFLAYECMCTRTYIHTYIHTCMHAYMAYTQTCIMQTYKTYTDIRTHFHTYTPLITYMQTLRKCTRLQADTGKHTLHETSCRHQCASQYPHTDIIK